MNKDLTVGRPGTGVMDIVLYFLCLEVLFFSSCTNRGQSGGGKIYEKWCMAAVGNSYEITLIFIAFAFGCNIGCSVIVSQLFGQSAWQT
ncbi:MAG: hypothetical protein V8S76_05615 [Lachnospiraceae bacterium]